jgi:hypothetical protein
MDAGHVRERSNSETQKVGTAPQFVAVEELRPLRIEQSLVLLYLSAQEKQLPLLERIQAGIRRAIGRMRPGSPS